MYIKNIKIQGFKSFADKLELDFNTGISAIVGPNGSGKSNIVDAILWVLGEQSVKLLRGDSAMSDVIFSGSKSRDAIKKASVAITFDNTDHVLLTELNEVEVKRVIYSTGENEYYINNAHVRLKDISDLLIDVTSKFNIVTQGNINALVENKSSERRALFESAAGVLKYKKRKEEALRKLESTKENLTRVNLIIKELKTTLDPLEKQKNDAKKYIEIKNNLENIEISLIASDITSLTNKSDKLKNENSNLTLQIDQINNNGSSLIDKLKLDKIKLEENISSNLQRISDLKTDLASLQGQKQVMIERSNYALDKGVIDNNLLKLNEEKSSFESNIGVLENEIEILKKKIQDYTKKLGEITDEEIKTKVKLGNIQNDINKTNANILLIQNKIKIENSNIENNSFLPKSISTIINNHSLKGIHNTIGNLIEVNDKHSIAISTALGQSANFIIVDSMKDAKRAIEYLKENHLGRATFFPIDTIKSRKISKDIEYTLSSLSGFIGIASNLVKHNEIYNDIIENQLGNVIIVDSIDDLFEIAKIVEYKYKIVSLQGDVIFPGGSVSGGTFKENNNKSLIIKLNADLQNAENSLQTSQMNKKAEESKLEIIQSEESEIHKIITENRIILEAKEDSLQKCRDDYSSLINSLSDLKDIKAGKIDDSLNKLINTISDKEKTLKLEEISQNDLKSKLFDITNQISEEERNIQENNAKYRNIESKIQNNEVNIAKCEVQIDNLLNTLSEEYNMSYEHAIDNYYLDLDVDEARTMVSKYKTDLKGLNNVNLGSIEEYDRLKKRFDFLDKQRNDLEISSGELLNIIKEMDDIMIDKFKKTFDLISKEFTKIFRIMFKGGNGLLKLTDESDLLNTGINIMAVPPGKKLNSTASLSGGEKALTAICLIFSILKVRPAPFIVLDEVEAALDEENVNMFGEYLMNIKKDSQFILITHKKKMMEYADILYGVTMQESGVSKLVSVSLEDAN